MLRRTEGIVLRSVPYGEADLIVTYLTLDFGIVNAFAKSPRKVKSRFGSSLEPLTHSRVSLFGKEDARLPRLTQSDTIDPFQELREGGLPCFRRLSGMVELTLGFLPPHEPNRRAFSLLKEILLLMRADCSPLYALLYRIRFLKLMGYAPGLDCCARCKGDIPPSAIRFYASQGATVCAGCAAGLDSGPSPGLNIGLNIGKTGADIVGLGPGSVKLYLSLVGWELSKAGRIKASEGMLEELNRMLDAHIQYRLSRPLKVTNRMEG